VRGTVARFAVALATTAIGVGFAIANPAGAAPDATGTTGAAAAPAQEGCGDGVVNVVEVDGLLDTVLADFVADEVAAANDDDCVRAVVLQLDTGGSTVSDGRMDDLVAAVETSDVPVTVWVGPSGSRVTEEGLRLLAAAEVVGVSAGSSIEVTPALLDARGVAPADLGDVDVGDRVGAERAVELGLVDNDASVIVDFVGGLDEVESEVVDGERQPVTQVRFASLDIVGQLMHTVASPPVAYLLFVIGLTLLLFELYTAGVGVAGVTGAGFLLLGSYGLVSLPTRPIGVALLLLAMFAYGVDIQTGVPRVWTGIGTVAFVLGSLVLYDGVSISWVTLLIAFVGITLTMLAGMPTMVRTRFSTPTIGREWMVGEMGSARTDVDPDGVVTVRDAPWRARTNRATPIRRDDAVRVVAIDGLVLEVEPEEGGARDYRERRTTAE
jgi:membrane-bound serine protease (ClpP class)